MENKIKAPINYYENRKDIEKQRLYVEVGEYMFLYYPTSGDDEASIYTILDGNGEVYLEEDTDEYQEALSLIENRMFDGELLVTCEECGDVYYFDDFDGDPSLGDTWTCSECA